MNKILGILWDYDGTLFNTANKNIEVTIEVLKHFDKEIEKHLPEALTSYEKYQEANHKYKNWQELYIKAYNIKEEDLNYAGSLWTPEQKKNKTEPLIFDRIPELIKDLKQYKMAICSQNGKEIIKSTLKKYNIKKYFDAIIGSTDVIKQKPDPEGFIKCTKQLNKENEDGIYIYIGDHSDDITFGKNAEKILNEKAICIIIDHLKLNTNNYQNWQIKPDFYVENTLELKNTLNQLKQKNLKKILHNKQII